MPFFVAVDPEKLIITEAYEYTNAYKAEHIEVLPPLDIRALDVSRDPSSGEIILSSNVVEYNRFHAWEISVHRSERNELLFKSDWTQGIDSPLTDEQKATWRVYRQQLRDLVYPFPPAPSP